MSLTIQNDQNENPVAKWVLSLMLIIIILWAMCGCKTTYVDAHGNKKPTANTRHINRVHPHGFYAGGKHVQPCCGEVKTTVKH